MKDLDPYTIIGWGTNLGYLYCVECHEQKEKDVPIYIDECPHAFELCDCCGVILNYRFREPTDVGK